jgi:predicted O-methyltransferase YrrM
MSTRVRTWLLNATRRQRLVLSAFLLGRRCRRQRTLDGVVDAVMASRYFQPMQIKSEILTLLARVQGLRPERICEIGGGRGGTAFLLASAAPDAQLVSVDIAYAPAMIAAIRAFQPARQTVRCLPCDSHDPQTGATLVRMFGGRAIDVLLIDGDHAFDGVRQDFRLYAPLVRCGGIVAIHDIIPDHRARFGKNTTNDSGEVPEFWKLLKDRYPYTHREYVADHEQDGYGIGVLEWRGDDRIAEPIAAPRRNPEASAFPC